MQWKWNRSLLSALKAVFLSASLLITNSAYSASEAALPALSRFLDREGANINESILTRNTAAPNNLRTMDARPTQHHDKIVVNGLIVRFVDPQAKADAENGRPPSPELIKFLQGYIGKTISFNRTMSLGSYVFSFDSPMEWHDIASVIKQLSQDPRIEEVEPDVRLEATFYPNDPYLFYQWPLAPPEFYPGAINAIQAWDITKGSKDTIVAVLDTGIAVTHAFGYQQILAGYDFISDPFYANDGDGRDPNPADPGDWEEAGECSPSSAPRGSSWHGTFVSGIIATPGNDYVGTAGVNWNTRILPVRVLGKCGGSISDLIDGMRWAVGLEVPGAPTNPNPARILNLSLGAPSPFGCTSRFLLQAINEVKQQNSLIVVAAGNNDVEAATFIPASCNGVMTVGAVDHLGWRSSFSNYSFSNRVHISAPGGDMSFYGEPDTGVLSVADAGRTHPTGSLQYVFSEGTSMAAPHVSAVAALAMAIDPDQHTQMISAIMRITSRMFPEGSDCDILYPLCGDGLLDAYNTLQAVSILKPYHLVWGFYNSDINHYFRAGGYDEVELVLSGVFGDWIDTEDYFIAWRDSSQGAVPVCRFYGTPGIGPNSHFYTGDPEECEKVKREDPGWSYEGTAFYIKLPVNGECPDNTLPVYRYYNNRWMHNDSNHRYVIDLYDQAEMVEKGWILEGIAMCAAG